MSLKTKREICDELLYQIYGGMPTNDTTISLNFALRLLNNKIAEAAVKSAFGSYNLDGCVCADDLFTLNYSNITLLTDTELGMKYFAHPVQPVGLPGRRAITISPVASRGGLRSDIFKPIQFSDLAYTRSLPGLKKAYHFTLNGREYFADEYSIMATVTAVNLSVVSSGANDLAAFLNLPDDMVSAVKLAILPELKMMIGMSDTTPLPNVDAPESRT